MTIQHVLLGLTSDEARRLGAIAEEFSVAYGVIPHLDRGKLAKHLVLQLLDEVDGEVPDEPGRFGRRAYGAIAEAAATREITTKLREPQ